MKIPEAPSQGLTQIHAQGGWHKKLERCNNSKCWQQLQNSLTRRRALTPPAQYIHGFICPAQGASTFRHRRAEKAMHKFPRIQRTPSILVPHQGKFTAKLQKALLPPCKGQCWTEFSVTVGSASIPLWAWYYELQTWAPPALVRSSAAQFRSAQPSTVSLAVPGLQDSPAGWHGAQQQGHGAARRLQSRERQRKAQPFKTKCS